MTTPLNAFVPEWDYEVTMDELMEFRRALSAFATALGEQQAQIRIEQNAIKQIVAIIDRRLGIRPPKPSNVPGATIASAAQYSQK